MPQISPKLHAIFFVNQAGKVKIEIIKLGCLLRMTNTDSANENKNIESNGNKDFKRIDKIILRIIIDKGMKSIKR